jgi:hypothetical protein
MIATLANLPPPPKKKTMIKSSNISPKFQCFCYWRVFAKIRPEKCDFDQCKGFFMGKNGPNWPNSEKIKIKIKIARFLQ